MPSSDTSTARASKDGPTALPISTIASNGTRSPCSRRSSFFRALGLFVGSLFVSHVAVAHDLFLFREPRENVERVA